MLVFWILLTVAAAILNIISAITTDDIRMARIAAVFGWITVIIWTLIVLNMR